MPSLARAKSRPARRARARRCGTSASSRRPEERDVMPMNKSPSDPTKPPSARIDARIAELDDWRGKTLAKLRALIKEAEPGVVEEWKWNVPVWSRDGIIC